jgi:hypothetical protein
MRLDLKDKIGVQKFGPLLNVVKTMPPRFRICAFNELVKYYHYSLGSIPPNTLLEPFFADQEEKFLCAAAATLQVLQVIAPHYARQRGLQLKISADSEKMAEEFFKFMCDFQNNREVFRTQINFMFPVHNTYEEALRDALRNILLIQRTLRVQIKKDLCLTKFHFRNTKEDEPDAKMLLNDRIMWCSTSKHICNKILKHIDAGLRMGDREAVIQVYAFATQCSFTREKDTLPPIAVNFLQQLEFLDEREFAKWKVSLMSAKVADLNRELNPDGWVMVETLYHSLMARIRHSLAVFLCSENLVDKIDIFKKSVLKFKQAVHANSVEFSLTANQARDFFLDKFNREIPEIINSNPDFSDFMDLDDGHMKALLKGIRECDAPPPSFVDFGGAADIERELMMDPKSSSKNVKLRRSRRSKKKRLAKLARPNQPCLAFDVFSAW